MKKTALFFMLMVWGFFALGQEVIYTISASINGESTPLDSILFENIDNQTRFLVSDLPLLPVYDIDLSLQLLVTGIKQIGLPIEKGFRLVKNIPGGLGLQFTGNVAEQVRLTVYNISGQMVYTRTLPAINPLEMISLNISGTGMYLLSFETKIGRVHYKALGSFSGGRDIFSLSVISPPSEGVAVSTPIETQAKSALSDRGFRYEMGDSLRVTAFLDGYSTTPHGGRINGSRNISFAMLPVAETGTFTDPRDGLSYNWVRIGVQVWMAGNLKYLPAVSGPGTGSETEPYYHVYGYDGTDVSAAKETENFRNYGVLYNWPAAMAGAASSSENPSGVQGICPPGWHVPSDKEWTQLVNYVVAQGYPNEDVVNGAGNALKSCRQTGSPFGEGCNTPDHPRWDAHDTHYGLDVFGFTALPGGFYDYTGSFGAIGSSGGWWSTTENQYNNVLYKNMRSWYGYVHHHDNPKGNGFSARCVRDAD